MSWEKSATLKGDSDLMSPNPQGLLYSGVYNKLLWETTGIKARAWLEALAAIEHAAQNISPFYVGHRSLCGRRLKTQEIGPEVGANPQLKLFRSSKKHQSHQAKAVVHA